MAASSPTSRHSFPEKLPWDQLWRLTMLESLAKVTTMSVTAVQM